MAAAVISVVQGNHEHSDAGKRKPISFEYFELLQSAFTSIDIDDSNTLDRNELQQLWHVIFPRLPEKMVEKISDDIYQDLDPNQDGYVKRYEFESYFGHGSKTTRNEVDRMFEDAKIRGTPDYRETLWAMVAGGDAPSYTDPPAWLPIAQLICFIVSNSAILISIGNFIVESLPSQYSSTGTDKHSSGFAVETVCIVVFTVEFLVAASTCPSPRKFWASFFTWIDVLAILPYYIGVFLDSPAGPLVVLRVLRLLRLLRMLKLGRHFEAVQVLVIAISRTAYPLLVSMLGINTVAIILFASLMASAERMQAHFDEDLRLWVRDNNSEYADAGESISFQSVPVAMWWAWVTLTTVGYGDMFPATAPGKAVASITMCSGLVLMSFPLTLLASAFAETQEELRTKKMAKGRGASFQAMLQDHAEDIRVVREKVKRIRLGGASCGHAVTASSPQIRAPSPNSTFTIEVDRDGRRLRPGTPPAGGAAAFRHKPWHGRDAVGLPTQPDWARLKDAPLSGPGTSFGASRDSVSSNCPLVRPRASTPQATPTMPPAQLQGVAPVVPGSAGRRDVARDAASDSSSRRARGARSPSNQPAASPRTPACPAVAHGASPAVGPTSPAAPCAAPPNTSSITLDDLAQQLSRQDQVLSRLVAAMSRQEHVIQELSKRLPASRDAGQDQPAGLP